MVPTTGCVPTIVGPCVTTTGGVPLVPTTIPSLPVGGVANETVGALTLPLDVTAIPKSVLGNAPGATILLGLGPKLLELKLLH